MGYSIASLAGHACRQDITQTFKRYQIHYFPVTIHLPPKIRKVIMIGHYFLLSVMDRQTLVCSLLPDYTSRMGHIMECV